MRKCRKMISVIMLMVMLATLTPFQALAADIPTNGTDETITRARRVRKARRIRPGRAQRTREQGLMKEKGLMHRATIHRTILTPAIRHLQETRAQILRPLDRIL